MAYRSLENTIKDTMRSANKTLGENVECGECSCDPCTCDQEMQLDEKTLTPAEKKKREEVAQAIERDNPGMPMDKKMAIATATAKRVAEAKIDEAKTPTNMQIHKVLYPTKNSREGIAALKKAFRVNDAEAKKMLNRVMNEAKDPNEYDQEGDMMKTQLRKIDSAVNTLMGMVKDDDNLPEWVQSKMTKATDYIRSVRDYLESEKMNEEIQGKQLAHHGQTTKNFEICPSALKAFNDNQKAGMGDKDGFHDAVVAVDKYLGIEKALVNKGSATKADMDRMEAAVNDAKEKISAAGLPGHDYHKIHVDAVKELMDEQINEAYSPMHVKQAIGIASDKRYKGGNMTGAVASIEKLKKGLSNHPQVVAVLKRQNEELGESNSSTETLEELTAAEKKLINTMYDKKGNLTPLGKRVMDHGKKAANEEVELDEISSNKLGDYMRKSTADAGNASVFDIKRQNKRIGGQKMADDKIRKKMGKSSSAKVPAGMNTDKQTNEAKKPDETGNIRQSLKKAIDLRGQKEIVFKDGSKGKISVQDAEKAMKMLDNTRMAKAKQDLTIRMMKSHQEFKDTLAGKKPKVDPFALNVKKVNEISMDMLKKNITKSNMTSAKKAMNVDQLRKQIDQMKKRAGTEKPIRENEMAVTRRGDYGMEKVRMPDGTYKWKKKPKKEISVESRNSDT